MNRLLWRLFYFKDNIRILNTYSVSRGNFFILANGEQICLSSIGSWLRVGIIFIRLLGDKCWFGHILWQPPSYVRNKICLLAMLPPPGPGRRVRPKKCWQDVVKGDMRTNGLTW